MAKRRSAARADDQLRFGKGTATGQVTPGLPGAPKVGGVRQAALLSPVIIPVSQLGTPPLPVDRARDRVVRAAAVNVLGPGSAKPPAVRDPRARAVAGRRGR